MRNAAIYLGSIMAALTMSACGSDTNAAGNPESDTVRIERNEGLQKAVKASCDAYTKCNLVGPEEKYSSRQDCEIKQRDTYNSKWSEERCGGAHAFVKAKLNECINRTANWNCEGNILDKLGFETECSEKKVCALK